MLSAAIATLLFLVERSLFGALPDPFPRTPLVLACGTYLVQHLDLRDGAAWIILSGLLSDVIGLTAPGAVLAGAVAAATCLTLSRSVFTNRSLYGIVACGACTMIAWAVTYASLLAIQGALAHAPSGWADPILGLPSTLVLGTVILAFLFRLAKRLRGALSSAIMLNR